MAARPIKVLVIDDSALVREALTRILGAEKDIEVSGTASDPLHAVKKIKEQRPDVLTLDLEMPRMDGLTFLRKIMSVHPLPVVVISSLTQRGSSAAIRALELGAVDFVPKPKAGISGGLSAMASEIIEKVRGAAAVNRERLQRQARHSRVETGLFAGPLPFPREHDLAPLARNGEKVIAIGASTGGTVAVKEILTKLPANTPGVIVVLHMPAGFTASYARNLDACCPLKVKEAADGDPLSPGCAYIAPGGRHLLLARRAGRYYLQLDSGPPVNRHRPSVDKTFFSVAEGSSPHSMGIILTGMGEDGARGLKEMRDRGSLTVAQDEQSCVVYGMPKKAVALGAVDRVLPLDEIAPVIAEFAGEGHSAS